MDGRERQTSIWSMWKARSQDFPFSGQVERERAEIGVAESAAFLCCTTQPSVARSLVLFLPSPTFCRLRRVRMRQCRCITTPRPGPILRSDHTLLPSNDPMLPSTPFHLHVVSNVSSIMSEWLLGISNPMHLHHVGPSCFFHHHQIRYNNPSNQHSLPLLLQTHTRFCLRHTRFA